MRSPPTLAIAALVVAAAFSTAAQSLDNPWCAFFSDGHTECGFATLQGCMAAIYGNKISRAMDRMPAQRLGNGPMATPRSNGCNQRRFS
jgi:hypothetical protein